MWGDFTRYVAGAAVFILFSVGLAKAEDLPELYTISAVIDLDLKITDRKCQQTLGPRSGLPSGPYRLILEVGPDREDTELPWRIDLYEDNQATDVANALVLTSKRVEAARKALPKDFTKARFITPILNRNGNSYCLDEITLLGVPPKITIIGVIAELSTNVPLSAKIREKGELAHFVDAAKVWENPLGEFGTIEAQNNNTPDEWKKRLWSDALLNALDGQSLEADLRARMKRAFESVVWMENEAFAVNPDLDISQRAQREAIALKDPRRGWLGPCTAFFVAQDVLATAGHCTHQLYKGQSAYKMIKQGRGWQRPVAGASNRDKAPEMQALFPAVVGEVATYDKLNESENKVYQFEEFDPDFALIWVADPKDYYMQAEPVKLAIWPETADKWKELTVLGFPKGRADKYKLENFPLVLSYDEDCVGSVPAPDSSEAIRHGCDTYGGNSGSPVYDRDLGEVGAIHVRGFPVDCSAWAGGDASEFEQYRKDCWNEAIPVAAIKRAINDRYVKLMAKSDRTEADQIAIDIIQRVRAAQPALN